MRVLLDNVCIRLLSVCIRMLSVRYLYVVRVSLYVTPMSSVCCPYVTRMLSVCYWYVPFFIRKALFVCYLYVTRLCACVVLVKGPKDLLSAPSVGSFYTNVGD